MVEIENYEVVKCPSLNTAFRKKVAHSSPDLEVIVGFARNGQPVGIMCDRYNPKTNECSVDEKKCTYSKWEMFE